MSKAGSDIIDHVLQRKERRWVPSPEKDFLLLLANRSSCLVAVSLFKHRHVIDMIATHPAYWRRGHASLMMDWLIELAKLDATGLAVTATPMGKMLFTSKGFFEKQIVRIPGYELHPQPIFGWLGLSDMTKEQPSATQTAAIIRIYQILSYLALLWPVAFSFSLFRSDTDTEKAMQARFTKEHGS